MSEAVDRLRQRHGELVERVAGHEARLNAAAELGAELEALKARLADQAAELAAMQRRQVALAARVEHLLSLKQGPPGKEGRPGRPGIDGRPGPPGESAATVIREVKIVG